MDRSLQWDIFCKVIDNHGDIGICWRLSADLAARGQKVRLWVDDASALAWMAPAGASGVTVLPWTEPLGLNLMRLESAPCEVLVEAFGCEVAPEFLTACAEASLQGAGTPVWINLEYLSAESYVERSHALPSPVSQGPAAGWRKWFFYPGFSSATGGLLREPDLQGRQAAFNRDSWLAAQGIAPRDDGQAEQYVALFCYEPPALAALLERFARHGLAGQPVRLLVAAGRAEHAVKALFNEEIGHPPLTGKESLLSISYLPLLTQSGFDHLLWACDLNFVRGEDSIVRALWAGKPFVWQIYPQGDQAHLAKLDAFLDMLDAPASWRLFHAAWNSPSGAIPAPEPGAWSGSVQSARGRLLGHPDLSTQLMAFARKAASTS